MSSFRAFNRKWCQQKDIARKRYVKGKKGNEMSRFKIAKGKKMKEMSAEKAFKEKLWQEKGRHEKEM